MIAIFRAQRFQVKVDVEPALLFCWETGERKPLAVRSSVDFDT
ncbi:MAG: hypothetical protein U0894_07860 [Pirellulales bacterium]